MKKLFLFLVLLMMVTLVVARPPPPPPPAAFGGAVADDNVVEEDFPVDFPDAPVSGSKTSNVEDNPQLKLVELENRIDELETNTGMLSTPYIILLSVNLVLIGLVFYLFYLIRPHEPYQ